jgi:hypothetical protein
MANLEKTPSAQDGTIVDDRSQDSDSVAGDEKRDVQKPPMLRYDTVPWCVTNMYLFFNFHKILTVLGGNVFHSRAWTRRRLVHPWTTHQ